MRQTFLKTIGVGILAISMLAVFAEIRVSAQNGSKALEGSWDALVTFRVCQTGAAIRTFPAMNTFARGGTVQEYGVGSAPAPRGPGHGVWSHLFERNFFSTFQFFRFSADGTYIGKAVARRNIEVDISGDSYSSTNTTDFFDVDGNLIMTGCATEAGTRFE